MTQILYVCQTEAAANAKFKELVALYKAEEFAEQYNHQRRWLWLPNGVTYDVRTVSSDLRGVSYDKVIVDEYAELDEDQISFYKSLERPSIMIEEPNITTVTLPVNEQSLLFRLRKRAEIRRQIPSRKSVEEGKPDRIADLLEEAADEIERLQGFVAKAVIDKLTR